MARPRRGPASVSAESLVASLSQDLHNRLKRKPLGDLFVRTEPPAELGARKLHDLGATLLGDALLNVAFITADVNHVLVVDNVDSELGGVFFAHLLGVVWAVEVVRGDGALRARHVPPDDEVRRAIVLPDDHVLDRLARPRHFHAVGQIRPAEHGELLLGLLSERLVGVDAHEAVDVPRLGRAAGGMHEQRGVLDVALRTFQELKVRLVDRIAVLESDDLLASRQRPSHLRGCLRRVWEPGACQTVEAAPDVVRALL
mmetsp:Transcript_5158/g.12805  ORF Transcript_5158/g.12805 Transcript_5158/m.12805 type:complete len:257 (-) Transcript_5158:1396-2166(-)